MRDHYARHICWDHLICNPVLYGILEEGGGGKGLGQRSPKELQVLSKFTVLIRHTCQLQEHHFKCHTLFLLMWDSRGKGGSSCYLSSHFPDPVEPLVGSYLHKF